MRIGGSFRTLGIETLPSFSTDKQTFFYENNNKGITGPFCQNKILWYPEKTSQYSSVNVNVKKKYLKKSTTTIKVKNINNRQLW